MADAIDIEPKATRADRVWALAFVYFGSARYRLMLIVFSAIFACFYSRAPLLAAAPLVVLNLLLPALLTAGGWREKAGPSGKPIDKHYSFSPTGIRWVFVSGDDRAEGVHEWRGIEYARETSSLLLLISKGAVIILPKRDISRAKLHALRELLRGYVTKAVLHPAEASGAN